MRNLQDRATCLQADTMELRISSNVGQAVGQFRRAAVLPCHRAPCRELECHGPDPTARRPLERALPGQHPQIVNGGPDCGQRKSAPNQRAPKCFTCPLRPLNVVPVWHGHIRSLCDRRTRFRSSWFLLKELEWFIAAMRFRNRFRAGAF
jgi:hypothetical protein